MYDSNDMWVGSEGECVRGNVQWGGDEFSPAEWGSGIAGPNVTNYDQWGNPVSMGARQMGLTLTKNFTDYMGAGGPFAGVKSIFDAVATPSTPSVEMVPHAEIDMTGPEGGYGQDGGGRDYGGGYHGR